MAAPVMRTTGFVSSSVGSNQTTLTIDLPTHAAGETLYVAITSDAPGQVFGIPADWSKVITDAQVNAAGSDQATFVLISKVAGGSEPASISVTQGTSERAVWICFAVQGANGLDGSPTSNTGGSSATAQLPAITTTVADTLVVGLIPADGIATPYGSATGYSKLSEVSLTSAGSLAVFYQTVATASTVAAQNVTITTEQWRGFAIAIKGAGGTAYNQNVSGSVTPSGTKSMRLNRALGGTVTSSGSPVKRLTRALTGALTPTGTVTKRLTRALTGALTPSGAVVVRLVKILVLAGSLTPSGSLRRVGVKLLGGTVAPSGSLLRRLTRLLGGTVTPSGVALKRLSRALAGNVTPSGSLLASKIIRLILAGVVAPGGALRRNMGKVLGGNVTPNGAPRKQLRRALGGSLTPSGAVVAARFVLKLLAGTVAPTGSLRESAIKRLAGTLTSAGAILKKTFTNLGGTVGSTGGASEVTIELPEYNLPRGTIYSSNNLSFMIKAPAWSTSSYFQDVSQDVITYEHSSSAFGGFWSARVKLRLPLSELDDWLINGVGRELQVKGRASSVAWEGIVNRVSLDVGGYSLAVGPYTDITNRVKLAYSLFLQLGGGQATGIRVETDYINDTTSQARYGILAKTYSAGGINEEVVDELQGMLLERFAYPPRSEDLTLPGGGSITHIDLDLECVGYVTLFEKYTYRSTASGLQSLSSKLASIINAEPNFLFSGRLAANDLQVIAAETENREAWAQMKYLLNLGDNVLNRYTLGVYENRQVHYRPVENEIVYIRPLREGASVIQDQLGGLLQPWQVRPGVYILVTDLFPGKPVNTTLAEDNRAIFAETVQFRMPDSLIINGAHQFRIEQKLAQLGISGIS